LPPGFETGRNLRYEAKSGQRADLKKRTQPRRHVLSGCRVLRLARNLRYEAKSGQQADLKKRTQRRDGRHAVGKQVRLVLIAFSTPIYIRFSRIEAGGFSAWRRRRDPAFTWKTPEDNRLQLV
jgi:hypothetical protein